MLTKIIAKELIDSVHSLRFAVLVLICCLLIPASVIVLSSGYVNEMEDYQGRIRNADDAMRSSESPFAVHRPFPQLTALFNGVSLKAVNSVELRTGGRWNRPISAAARNITDDLFPAVDVTFIVAVILSAMCLILSFDAVSGERAQGTLKLMLSNSMPRSVIIIGKWIGLTLTVLLVFTTGFAVSLLVFFNITSVGLTPGNWLMLAPAYGAAALLLATFVMIGILVSSFTGSPTQSVFLCLLVWGLLTFVVPQAALAAADVLQPLPATQQVERALREYFTEFCQKTHEFSEQQFAVAQREGWDIEKAVQVYRQRYNPGCIENLRKSNAWQREFWLQVERNEGLGRLLSMLSPVACVDLALTSLADTDIESQRQFLNAAYRYGERFYEELLLKRNGRSREEIADTFPKFQFTETPVESRLFIAAVPIAVMAVAAIVLALVAVIRFNGYDVR